MTIAAGSTGDREYTANWQPILEYRAYNTTTQEFESLTEDDYLTVSTSTTAMSKGWYAVRSNVTVSSRIEVTGTVNLILCDDATLTVPKGLHVPSGVTLNIYGQISGTGVLSATNVDSSQAAIGGNSQETSSGNVTIHGGNITATSTYDAAGIGGGDVGGNGGNVTIHGGIVTATGKNNAAGIGGGYSGKGGTVTITGGIVTATGGTSGGTGIGGAWNKAGGTVTITGGTVIAIAGNSNAQAIGHGKDSSESGTLTLGDMKVYDSADATDPVASASRESTCRTTYTKLMPCTNHNWVNYTCAWCGITCQVVYNDNNATGGTAPFDATEYTNGQTVTVLGNTGNLERTGYTFAGWNTAADGSGTDYAESATFTFTAPVTFYAKWIPTSIDITMNGAGIMTYSSEWPLDFGNVSSDTSGAELKAYVVSGFSPTTSSITLTAADNVPAYTGLLLKGTPGTVFTVPVAATDKAWANLLVGVTSSETVVCQTETHTIDNVTTQYTNFILANGKYGIDWYTLSADGAIGAHKAYLSLKTSDVDKISAGTRFTWIYEDATGITTTDYTNFTNGAWYTLDGKKLDSKPTAKGLYIYNGVKIIIK